MRRDRTRAFLTEFLIVVVFFSIAAVITVRLFVAASDKSRDSENAANAERIIQSHVESIMAEKNIEDTLYKYSRDVLYDKNWDECKDSERFCMKTDMVEDDSLSSGKMITANIVIYEKDEAIISTSIRKYFPREDGE